MKYNYRLFQWWPNECVLTLRECQWERNADESRGRGVNLGEHMSSDEYLRERLHPEYGDLTYLHLADLRLALEAIRTDRVIHLLDYGCGGSPYRSLFPNAIYKRADYLQDGE